MGSVTPTILDGVLHAFMWGQTGGFGLEAEVRRLPAVLPCILKGTMNHPSLSPVYRLAKLRPREAISSFIEYLRTLDGEAMEMANEFQEFVDSKVSRELLRAVDGNVRRGRGKPDAPDTGKRQRYVWPGTTDFLGTGLWQLFGRRSFVTCDLSVDLREAMYWLCACFGDMEMADSVARSLAYDIERLDNARGLPGLPDMSAARARLDDLRGMWSFLSSASLTGKSMGNKELMRPGVLSGLMSTFSLEPHDCEQYLVEHVLNRQGNLYPVLFTPSFTERELAVRSNEDTDTSEAGLPVNGEKDSTASVVKEPLSDAEAASILVALSTLDFGQKSNEPLHLSIEMNRLSGALATCIVSGKMDHPGMSPAYRLLKLLPAEALAAVIAHLEGMGPTSQTDMAVAGLREFMECGIVTYCNDELNRYRNTGKNDIHPDAACCPLNPKLSGFLLTGLELVKQHAMPACFMDLPPQRLLWDWLLACCGDEGAAHRLAIELNRDSNGLCKLSFDMDISAACTRLDSMANMWWMLSRKECSYRTNLARTVTATLHLQDDALTEPWPMNIEVKLRTPFNGSLVCMDVSFQGPSGSLPKFTPSTSAQCQTESIPVPTPASVPTFVPAFAPASVPATSAGEDMCPRRSVLSRHSEDATDKTETDKAFAVLRTGVRVISGCGGDDAWLDMSAHFPWASAANLAVSQAAAVAKRGRSQVFRMSPLLLVGPPGTGKSRWTRKAAGILGLPFYSVSFAGANTAVLVNGTERGWSGAQPGLVARAMRDTDCANPMVLVDEVDKAGTSHHNGNAVTALLPLLERETAERFPEACLLARLDASAIAWVLTANSLANVSPELLSRVTVIEFEAPSPEHLPLVLAGMREDLVLEWDMTDENVPSMDGVDVDELQRMHRDGRSLRVLKKRLRTMLLDRMWQPPVIRIH